MSAYGEKLKDPRWQKRRLEILQRDDWECRRCGDKESTLHAHHRFYRGEPWEAPDHALLTLCEECHVEETREWAQEGRYLLRELAENTHWDSSDLNSFMCAVHGMVYTDHPNIVWRAIEDALTDPAVQQAAIEKSRQRKLERLAAWKVAE